MKYLLFLLWIIHIESVQGHGKLWEPPARSTMWRRGFNTPRNANDNELNCGGFQVGKNINYLKGCLFIITS